MKRRKLTTTLAAVLAAAMLVTGCGADTDRNPDEVTTQEHDEDTMVHLESLDEVSALFDDVYAQVSEDILPAYLETSEVDLQDMDSVTYQTGLTDITGIEGIYMSESGIGSIAYSAMYIRTNDDADVDQIKKRVFDKRSSGTYFAAKWICVTAEKEIANSFGKDIFFVMGDSDTADSVYEAAVKAAEQRNMTVSDQILEKENPI